MSNLKETILQGQPYYGPYPRYLFISGRYSRAQRCPRHGPFGNHRNSSEQFRMLHHQKDHS